MAYFLPPSFSMMVSTTLGSASVDRSPSESASPDAHLRLLLFSLDLR
jgi:hypothetical protein